MHLYILLVVISLSLRCFARGEHQAFACKSEFFSLLQDKMPWHANQSEDCISSFTLAKDRFAYLSHTMVSMNTTLTIYTTMQKLQHCRSLYSSLPNISIRSFNATELLDEYGYTGMVKSVMDQWKLTGYTRSSDILRLMLVSSNCASRIDLVGT